MSPQEKYPYYPAEQPVPETPEPGSPPKPWGKTTMVGKRQPRVDGDKIVSGQAVYPSDTSLPGMLTAAVLRSPHPSAVVKRVDAGAAEQMPGVRAVLTGASPEADLWWTYGNDVRSKLFDPRCRFEGEAVAAVAAETSHQAWDALKAIKVVYDVLPPRVVER
ncbi:MAG: xanthine dehydrogenase family protein molybdopterin-binding subunit, partial [Syntrophales bacterium]